MLGGVLFVRNGIKYDYPFQQAIECLKDFCDKVVVVVVDGEDNTIDVVKSIPNIDRIIYSSSEWEFTKNEGSERLSIFTNAGINYLSSQYPNISHVFVLQADEIVHEDCYEIIRGICDEKADYSMYMCARINLWGTPIQYLDYPANGQPCSTQIVRLAKMKDTPYAYGDAESISVMNNIDKLNLKATGHIRIYHAGFIRDPFIHPGKIKNMQEEVFNMESDKKLEGMQKFNPWKWHGVFDLEIIHEQLPKRLLKWANLRNY